MLFTSDIILSGMASSYTLKHIHALIFTTWKTLYDLLNNVYTIAIATNIILNRRGMNEKFAPSSKF